MYYSIELACVWLEVLLFEVTNLVLYYYITYL